MNDNKINILVVDDEEQFLTSISKRLELRDFNVIAVNRGEKAIEAAREHPVDIALVDLRMPGIDGETTLEKLKKEHPWVEVVILTGHGSIDSATDCAKKGAYSYLQKPCELERLLEVLVEAYGRKIQNKLKIEDKRMEQLMKDAGTLSPLAILRRMKELENES